MKIAPKTGQNWNGIPQPSVARPYTSTSASANSAAIRTLKGSGLASNAKIRQPDADQQGRGQRLEQHIGAGQRKRQPDVIGGQRERQPVVDGEAAEHQRREPEKRLLLELKLTEHEQQQPPAARR